VVHNANGLWRTIMTPLSAHVRRCALVLPAVVVACSVNRPISPTPEPAAVADYLAAHHHSDLLLTDSVGHSRWLHNARLDGDTLRGLRSRELPREQVAIPLTQVRSVAAPQFSTGRTAGLVGGVLGALLITIVVLAANGPHPVY
jgi:hypothetical protein